jgi:predicted MFS family arabinose efflux permease
VVIESAPDVLGPEHVWRRSFQPLMIAVGFAMGMTAPIELLFAKRLGVGPVGIGLFLICSAIAVLTVDVFGTRVIPRLDPRTALMAGTSIFGVSEILLSVANSLPLLIVGRVAQGFGGAVLGGATLQAAVRVQGMNRERALGSLQSSLLLGSAVGAPTGGYISTLLPGLAGFRLAFGACAMLSVVIAVTVRMRLPSIPTSEQVKFGRPRFGGAPAIAPALALGVLGHFLRSGVESTAIPLVGDARGFSTATIGMAIGVLAAVQIVTLRIAGRLFERLPPTRCMGSALTLGIGAAAILAFVPGKPAFLFVALLFGMVNAVAMLAPPLVIMALSRDASTGLASYRIACGVGSVIGATSVNAALAAAGVAAALSGVGAVLVGGVALTYAVGRRVTPATK